MIELSPLRLKRASEVLVVANTPTYLVNTLLRTGYPQTLAASFSSEQLKETFESAAARSDFEQYDDVSMLLVLLALAVGGDLDAISTLPEPKIRPKFLSEVEELLPYLVTATLSQSVSLDLRPKTAVKGNTASDNYHTGYTRVLA